MHQEILNLEKLVPAPSLTEMALASIKEAILSKKLEPERMYTEAVLTNELGISRTPVREALIHLASQGLITYFPRKGFQVKSLTVKDVENLFELRVALELSVVGHIASRLTDTCLAEIEKIWDQYVRDMQHGKPAMSIRANRAFHAGLATLTGNDYLIKALDQISDLTDLVSVRSLEFNARALEAVREHGRILGELKQKSLSGALTEMEAHIRTTEKRVLARIRN
jgi:GntR family transcriptional regulator, rspAB operon transcriptional repressor